MREQLGHEDLQTTLDHYVSELGDAQLHMVDELERLIGGLLRENGRKAPDTVIN